MKEVGAYEAKTSLPALLRAVEKGERVVITRSGKPIADLMPHREAVQNPRQSIARIREMRRGVTLGEGSIKDLIEEGRR
jgi:prevent-host-death family protein